MIISLQHLPLRKGKSWKLIYEDVTWGKGKDLSENRRKRDDIMSLNCRILKRFYSKIKTRKISKGKIVI